MDKLTELYRQYAGDNNLGVSFSAGRNFRGGITMNNKQISLRGTLANDFLRLMLENECSPEDLNDYLYQLAEMDSPALLKVKKGRRLLIGKAEERGRFYPDW